MNKSYSKSSLTPINIAESLNKSRLTLTKIKKVIKDMKKPRSLAKGGNPFVCKIKYRTP